jgi:hypothetical protein
VPPVLSSICFIVSHDTDWPGGRLEVGGANVVYRHIELGSDLAEDEVWVEVRLDADWIAACLIEPEDGEPVIAELRVLPYEDDMDRNALRGPGEGSSRSAPPGGVPIESLRSLRSEDIVQRAREAIEELPQGVEYLGGLLAAFGL